MAREGRDFVALWIGAALAVAGAVVSIVASSQPWWITSVIALATGIITLFLLIVYGRRVVAIIDQWDQRFNAAKKRAKKPPSKARSLAAASLLGGLAVGIGWIGGAYLGPLTSSNSKAPTAAAAACSDGEPLLFAISGRMDRPAPVFTEAMQVATVNAINSHSPIGFLDIDGRPHVQGWINTGNYNNQVAKDRELSSAQAYATRIRAMSPHVDILDSLAIAGDAIHSVCSEGTLFLEDSGLQDTTPLNFTDNSLFTAAPTNVVNFLTREKELPNLRGITVTLVGIGYTAPPEAPLDIQQRDELIGIWSAVVKASKAVGVVIDHTPFTGAAPTGVPFVQLIQIPSLIEYFVLPGHAPVVLFDNGPDGFLPNMAQFRDPTAAAAALKEIAKYLKAHPSTVVYLIGTSADDESFSAATALSYKRADAVRSLLVELGVSPDQMTVYGVGWHFPGYQNDRGPDGTLLPGPAEHNWSVILSFPS